ncbi:hypothetical protein AB1L42_08805 [Thalassoglobus sp. JC818]|uniref:hypothetical protein n=1 Tax=Thalassoglobus sp. JC818 TaxID=3232136 RepID=UPI0034584643
MGAYRSKKLAILLVGLTILACFIPVFVTDLYTCAVCGKSRSLTQVFGFTIEASDSETPCSLWYDMNVESCRDHVWVRGTWRETKGLFSFPNIGSNISSRATGPLIRFGEGERLLIYQHSPDVRDARNVFLGLASWETDARRRRQQERLELELAEWVDSGFVGPLPQIGH